MSSDPFARMRTTLREQGIRRDALVRRATLGRKLIPGTYAAPSYAQHATPAIDEGEYVKVNEARRARLALVHRVMSRNERKQATVTLRKRTGLTSGARELMRAMRDIVGREANPRIALMEAGLDVREAHRKDGTQSVPRKAKRHSITRRARLYGLTDGLETRAAARGAHGDTAVKIVPGTRVTQRDHYKWNTRMLRTVGVATHPDASAENYSQAIDYIRRHPGEATVRVIHADGTSEIKAVADYQAIIDERRAKAREARKERNVRIHAMMTRKGNPGRPATHHSRILASDARFGTHSELAGGAA